MEAHRLCTCRKGEDSELIIVFDFFTSDSPGLRAWDYSVLVPNRLTALFLPNVLRSFKLYFTDYYRTAVKIQ